MPDADPIIAAIESSVNDAAGTPIESPDTTVDTGVIDDSSSDDSSTPEVVSPSADTSDPLTKELEELGLKEPKAGERENRLPYSRVKRIVENARKKQVEAHNTALAAEQAKYEKAQKRAEMLDNLDRIATNDPDRYMELLANANPAFKAYAKAKAAEAAVQPAPKAEEPPPHDWKYEDGTTGYSPAGQAKFLEWQGRQLETRIKGDLQKEYDRRFGPIEKQWKAQQVINEKLPVVRNQIQTAKDTWGELFSKNEPEILKFLQDNPQVSFADSVAKVLVPKAQANRDTMRADLIKEINARPRAAVKAAPAVIAASAKDNLEPKSMEDVIRESIKGLK